LTGLSAGFGGRTLFAHLDLKLRAGSWAAVTGPSGSGKSTLLSLIVGLLNPLAGTIDVGGAAWSTLSRDARSGLRREWLALVPQRPSLVEALTVRENLGLTATIRHDTTTPEDLEQVADRLGLFALLDQPVSLLSGGERQRTAIARCLVAQVPLLVLTNPPTTSLRCDDRSTRRRGRGRPRRRCRVPRHSAQRGGNHDCRFSANGPYAAG
jgi:ABC-type lipoprotein export system ATPase subunit